MRLNLDGQNAGARVKTDPDKRNPFEFALENQSAESPYAVGQSVGTRIPGLAY